MRPKNTLMASRSQLSTSAKIIISMVTALAVMMVGALPASAAIGSGYSGNDPVIIRKTTENLLTLRKGNRSNAVRSAKKVLKRDLTAVKATKKGRKAVTAVRTRLRALKRITVPTKKAAHRTSIKSLKRTAKLLVRPTDKLRDATDRLDFLIAFRSGRGTVCTYGAVHMSYVGDDVSYTDCISGHWVPREYRTLLASKEIPRCTNGAKMYDSVNGKRRVFLVCKGRKWVQPRH